MDKNKIISVVCAMLAAGSALATVDTLAVRHCHEHTHIVNYKKDGKIYSYQITHSHPHYHMGNTAKHTHCHLNLR